MIVTKKTKIRNEVLLILISALLIFAMLSVAVMAKDSKENSAIFLYLGSNYSLVDGEVKNIDENKNVVPKAKNATTLVPIRFISENLGYKVEWNDKTNKAIIIEKDKKIELTPNSNQMLVNNVKVPLLCPAEVYEERVFVPIRAIVESFGKKVDYYNGLISISDSDNTLKNNEKNNEIIRKINILPEVSSKEELIKILEDNGFSLNTRRTLLSGATMKSASKEMSINSVETEQVILTESFALQDTANAKQTDDFSKTNVQTEGVDEADIIKTDGKYIYQINQMDVSRLLVFDVSDPKNMKQVSELTLNEQEQAMEIYVHGDKIVMIANAATEVDEKGNYIDSNNQTAKKAIVREIPNHRIIDYVKTYVIDAKDKKNLKIDRITKVEGTYVSSRMINASLYLVTNKSIYGENDIMPLVSDNLCKELKGEYDAGGFTPISPTRIKCIYPIRSKNYINVAAFDITRNDEMSLSSYLGGGNNVYMSKDSLYIANTVYNNSLHRGLLEEINYEESKKEEAPKVNIETEVLKFALDKANITYISKVVVPGEIINQYSMNESKGRDFEIATCEVRSYLDKNTYKEDKSNSLYIYDEALNLKGALKDIAPGEQIYSTRFMGNKLYMVTFKTVDPLFVIDLADPTNPKILGSLKIPGYSDYLHPYDENHLIGFGNDTEEVKNEQYALYKGLKLALFDVSDFNNPKLMHEEIIGARGTTSNVLTNPRALIFSKEKNLLAFPIMVYEDELLGDNKMWPYFKFQGMYVYNITLDGGFKKLYDVTHISDEVYKKTGNYLSDYRNSINRGVYINDVLYTSSEGMIKSNNLYDGKELGILKIKQYINQYQKTKQTMYVD